jgi:hypothetical protein
MKADLIKELYKDIESGAFEEIISFHEKMLADDIFIMEFIYKLHYGPQELYNHCGKKGSVTVKKRKRDKKDSLYLRCSSCSGNVSLMNNTVVGYSKNRLSKFTQAINSPEKTISSFQKNLEIDVVESTAKGILEDLARQGIHPETETEIDQVRTKMAAIKEAWLELGEFWTKAGDLPSAFATSWKMSEKLIDKYASARIFETQCKYFFKKIRKK